MKENPILLMGTDKLIPRYAFNMISCLKSIMEMAEHNRVQLIWVPRHRGIEGNEITN
jgi:ribonuclease HI